MPDSPRSLQDVIRQRQGHGLVGRQDQVGYFEDNLALSAGDPRRRFILAISGQSGVGKTFLLRHLAQLASQHGAITAYVDEVNHATEAMSMVSAACRSAGQAFKLFERRQDELRKQVGEQEGPSDRQAHGPSNLASRLTKGTVKLGLRTASQHVDPGLGETLASAVDEQIIAENVDRLRAFVGSKIHDHGAVEPQLSAIDALSPSFVQDLRRVAHVSPLVLCFDTYERSAPFLEPWLLGLLEGAYGDLPADITLVIAGQNRLDVRHWAAYLPLVHEMLLERFTEAEARQMLAQSGISDEEMVSRILVATDRLPVFLAMVASAPAPLLGLSGPLSEGAVEWFWRLRSESGQTAAGGSSLLATLFQYGRS